MSRSLSLSVSQLSQMHEVYEKWKGAMLEVQRVTERNAEQELRISDLENERSCPTPTTPSPPPLIADTGMS
jgi:transcription elongation factor Elf1